MAETIRYTLVRTHDDIREFGCNGLTVVNRPESATPKKTTVWISAITTRFRVFKMAKSSKSYDN